MMAQRRSLVGLVLSVLCLSLGVAERATDCTTHVLTEADGLIPSLNKMLIESTWGTPDQKLTCSGYWYGSTQTASGDYNCGRAFDWQEERSGSPSFDCWLTPNDAAEGWVAYTFDKPTVVDRLSMQQNYAEVYEADKFFLEGSLDGSTGWTTVFDGTMMSGVNELCGLEDFTFPNWRAFLAYRVRLIKSTQPLSNGDLPKAAGVCEIQMYANSWLGDPCLSASGVLPQTPWECAQAPASATDGRCYAVWNSTDPASFQCRHTRQDPSLDCGDVLSPALQFSDRVTCEGTVYRKEEIESALSFLVEAEVGTASDSDTAVASCAVPVFWRPALDSIAATVLTALPSNSVQWSVFPELPVGTMLDPVTGVVQGSALVAALSPSSQTFTVTLSVSLEPGLAAMSGLSQPQFTKTFTLSFPVVSTADCAKYAPLSIASEVPASRFSQVQRWCALRTLLLSQSN